jgi:hypothetical protein
MLERFASGQRGEQATESGKPLQWKRGRQRSKRSSAEGGDQRADRERCKSGME